MSKVKCKDVKKVKVWLVLLGHFVALLSSVRMCSVLSWSNRNTTEHYRLIFCMFSRPNIVKWDNSGIINQFTCISVITTGIFPVLTLETSLKSGLIIPFFQFIFQAEDAVYRL